MTTHTPGPWSYDWEPGYCGELLAANGTSICTFNDEPKKEDARLIAAAAELLSILSEAIELQRKHYGDGMLLHLDMAEWAKRAEAALAKATGA